MNRIARGTTSNVRGYLGEKLAKQFPGFKFKYFEDRRVQVICQNCFSPSGRRYKSIRNTMSEAIAWADMHKSTHHKEGS